MALTGHHLRVAADYWMPWFGFTGDMENPFGIAWEMFQFFAKQLNFTYTLVKNVDGTWGINYLNGSASGMLGMVYRKEVDMALGPFVISEPRAIISDFSRPVYNDIYTILLPRPKLENDLGGILKPFSLSVWSVLLLFSVLSMILGTFLQRSSVVQTIHSNAKGTSTSKIFFYPLWILRTLTREVVEKLPTLDSGRIFIGTWILVSLLLTTAYSGILTSLLAVPKVNIPVDSVKDLVEYGKIPWAVEYGTVMMANILNGMNGTNEVWKTVGEKMEFVKDCYHAQHKIREEGIAILCDTISSKLIMDEEFSANGTCSLYLARETIYTASGSFLFQKGSPLTKYFNQWIDALRESGLIDKAIYDVARNASTCLLRPGTEEKNKLIVLGIQELAGVFLVLAAGLAFSVLGFGLEKLHVCVF